MKPFDLKKALEGHKLITRDKKLRNIIIVEVDLSYNNGPLRILYEEGGHDSRLLTGARYETRQDVLDLFLQEDSDLLIENTSYTVNNESFKTTYIISKEEPIKNPGQFKLSRIDNILIHEDENFLIYKRFKE